MPIVEGLVKNAKIYKSNILLESLGDKIQKFIDRIRGDIEEIEAMILTQEDVNETEGDRCNAKNLKYWKACLQNNIDSIIDIWQKPVDPSKNASLSESEHNNLQKKIVEEVAAKSQFFQSIKRVEDKAINKFFNQKVKEAEEVFAKASAQINDELIERIGELTVNLIAADVANINLNTDLIISAEDKESQDTHLAGDTGLEPS